jgi:hypothetical protein
MFSILIVLVVIAFIVRWVLPSQGGGRPELAAHYQAEIARLREEVDLLNSEVRRLSEEQSFMVRLLAAGEKPSPEAGLEAPAAPPRLPDSHEETT